MKSTSGAHRPEKTISKPDKYPESTRRKKRRKTSNQRVLVMRSIKLERQQQKFLSKMFTFTVTLLIILIKTTDQTSLPVVATQMSPMAATTTSSSTTTAQQQPQKTQQPLISADSANEHQQLSQSLLLVRALPISARNALAFFEGPGQQAADPPAAAVAVAVEPTSNPATTNQHHHHLHQKCHRTSSSSGGKLSNTGSDLFGGQVWAVEGASLKLNFVVLGHRLGTAQQGHPQQMPRLHLQWTRDGQSRLTSELLSPADQRNSNSERVFSVQLAGESERETIKHLLGLAPPFETLPRTLNNSMLSSYLNKNVRGANADDNLDDIENFHLVPFVDLNQVSKLEKNNGNPQLPLAVRQSIQQLVSKSKQQVSPNVPDDFINDGASIEWHKLGAHLARKLNNNNNQLNDCPTWNGVDNVEQLLIGQLEFAQVNVRDRGQYELNVCQQLARPTTLGGQPTDSQGPRSTSQCAQVGSISLQVVEDWPHFEANFEAQLLNVDDRLSIKCEASGFTLPQISWYLDGQLISESGGGGGGGGGHQQQHRSGRQPSGKKSNQQVQQMINADLDGQLLAAGEQSQLVPTPPPPPLLLLGNSFKIGDYVSQDSHVHSFINSTSVRLGDGGLYKCQANNGLHQVEHEARLDVRGPANIERLLPANLSALVGTQRLQIQCPFSGHPVGPIEWYFRPYLADASESTSASIGRRSARSSGGWFASWNLAAPATTTTTTTRPTLSVRQVSNADEPDQPDADKDEWLSQASSMTVAPEDYPEGFPDYPVPVVQAQNNLLDAPTDQMTMTMYDSSAASWPDDRWQQFGQISPDYDNDDLLADYAASSSSEFDLYAPNRPTLSTRRKRQVNSAGQLDDLWIKLPQSRRHQVLANGTLVIHEIWRQDRGLYKCKVHPADEQQQQHPNQHQSQHQLSTTSNELQLNVLIPPVISPFSSADLLREGMRNLLTCSAIEGDPPIRLRWLKDGRPIEEHLQQVALGSAQLAGGRQLNSNPQSGNGWPMSPPQAHQPQQSSTRITIENNNEYTSTLYFSHVDYRDNGNYTCMATNKAASVNYTTRMVVNVPPKWIKSPKDVDCVSGQNIIVDCQAEAHPNPRIWWEIGVDRPSSESTLINTKQQQQQPATMTTVPAGGQSNGGQQHLHAPNHYRTIISNSRIHILENASLVIRDVGKQDEGFYLCQAANNFGLLSSLIKLTVNVGASFPNKFSIKYVKLNDKIELDCDPTGQSPVTVTWFMRQTGNNNLNLVTNSSSMRPAGTELPSSSPVNSNHQQLGRRLFTGQIQTTISSLTKMTSDNHHHQQQQQQQHQQAAQTRQLSNQIEDLDYSGHNKHKLIEIDSSISFEIIPASSKSSAPPNEIVRLHLKQAKRSHSGEFICLAQNQFGGDEKVIRLLVQEAPDPVEELSVVQVDSRSISLAWSQPFNGNSPIVSYTLEWRPTLVVSTNSIMTTDNQPNEEVKWSHLIVQQPAATLSSLQPMTSYEIRVRAQNLFGYSQVSPSSGGDGNLGGAIMTPTISGPQPLVVVTSEEAPAAPPSEIRAVPLSSSSIQVGWSPPANHNKQSYSIKGYYLGYKPASASSATTTTTTTNANESFIFKTVSLFPSSETNQLQMVDPYSNNLFHSGNNKNNRANQTTASDPKHSVRVIIGDLKRSTKYSIIVQAFNSAGPGPQSDPIEARTLMNDPPPAPQLRVGSTTYTSLELQWSFYSNLFALPAQSAPPPPLPTSSHNRLDYNLMGQPELDSKVAPTTDHVGQSDSSSASLTIDGYHLFYRQANQQNAEQSQKQQWQEKKLSQETHTIVSLMQPTSGLTPIMMTSSRNDLTIVELSANKTLSSLRQRSNSTTTPFSTTTSSANRAPSFRYVLDQLSCGQAYQVYLVAFNSYGFGLPSEILRSKTRGGQPIAPRRQDFLTINSTFVQLNLDAWLDSGCPISNFEVKYKQLAGGRSEASSMLLTGGPANGSKHSWVLLSSNINPDEQRTIELRDLQAENWYAILASAESSAGKTVQSYAFMTLDKFNQQTNEASELYASLSGNNGGGGGGLPALFRSTSNPFKSIWFGNNGGHLGGPPNHGLIMTISPILISACLCLILFASCSLFLIKRYNNLMKSSSNSSPPAGGDTTSLDSRTGNLRHRRHQQHQSQSSHHQQQQQFGPSVMKTMDDNYVRPSMSPPSSSVSLSGSPSNNLNGTNSFSNHPTTNECYSMKLSPCKTGSTIITSTNNTTSGSSTAGSSALLLGTNNKLQHVNGTSSTRNTASICDSHNNNNIIYGPPSFPFHEGNSCSFNAAPAMDSINKFATLAHRPPQMMGSDTMEQQQLLMSQQFKTLQHHQNSQPRPISSTTFLPNQQVNICHQMTASNYQMAAAAVAEQQQQIYSKLRLLQQFNSPGGEQFSMNNTGCPQQQVCASVDLCSKQILEEEALNSYNQSGANVNQVNEQQLAEHVQNCQNSTCQQQQQQCGSQLNEHQDDYALPFPPKWV